MTDQQIGVGLVEIDQLTGPLTHAVVLVVCRVGQDLLTTGAPVGNPLTGHTRPVGAVATVVLPDGRPLAVTGSDEAVCHYLKRHLLLRGVHLERIRADRVLHEALTVGPDLLHLALVFNLSQTTATTTLPSPRSCSTDNSNTPRRPELMHYQRYERDTARRGRIPLIPDQQPAHRQLTSRFRVRWPLFAVSRFIPAPQPGQ